MLKNSQSRSSMVIALVICWSLGCLAATDDKDPPPDNICSFDTANYTVGESWHPFLLPFGYMPCIRCMCKWGFKVENIQDKVSMTPIQKRVQVPLLSCKTEICKKVTCPASYVPRGECCRRCPGNASSLPMSLPVAGRDCMLKGKRKRHGEVWAMDTAQDDQCTECSCMDSFISCAVRRCRKTTCKIPVPQNGTCCKTCVPLIAAPKKPGRGKRTGCSEMGRHYNEGDVWRPELQGSTTCVNCVCMNSLPHCTRLVCPSTDCENPFREHPGDCCSKCPEKQTTTMQMPSTTATSTPHRTTNPSKKPEDCLWYNKPYSNGTSWHPTVGDSVAECVVCTCTNTSISCLPILCPMTYPCAKPKKVQGTCCDVCPGFKKKVNQTIAPPKNRRSICSAAKYHWQVFEYVPSQVKKNLSSTKDGSKAMFVLVDTRASAGKKPKIELHQLEANTTNKFIKVWTIDATHFKSYARILKKKGLQLDEPARKKSNVVEVYQMDINAIKKEVKLEKEDTSKFEKMMNHWHEDGKFQYIGIVNEGRRRKIRKKESELCSGKCVKDVQVLVRIVKNRSQACHGSVSVPPDTLRMLNEG